MGSSRKLRKMSDEAWIGGVCAGWGYWAGCPVWLIRLVWFLNSLFYRFGSVVDVLLRNFLPAWEETPEDFEEVTGD